MAYDCIIIGAGPGGYIAALRARQLGLRVALVEKEHLGGVCLNWGCIPTKALLKSGSLYEKASEWKAFGVEASSITAHIQTMVKRSREVSASLAKGVAHLLKKNGVDVITGHGRLKKGSSPFQITVGDTVLEAKNVIIATGARARTLPFPKAQGVWTAKEAMLPESIPTQLLVIGAGAIGMEFASFYNALGTKVTVVEQQEHILPTEDTELALLAQKSFEKKGITFLLGTTLKELEKKGDQFCATLSKGPLWEGQQVLLAIGIVGNTDDLGLELTKARVERQQIMTHGLNETDEPGLYAIGDVAGAPWLAHKASHEAVQCINHIAGKHAKSLDPTLIPGCIYSMPQLASVGLTEKAALEKGYAIKVGRFPFSANGQAMAQGETEGLVKVIFDKDNGALLGAHLMGAGVTEMIQGFVIAKALEATEESLEEIIFAHPTLSEAMHEAVLDADGMALHK